jgi:hypothetical protein
MIHTFIINSILVMTAVLIHYEVLRLVSKIVPRLDLKHRLRVVFGVFGCLFAHVAEVWLFAIAYYVLPKVTDFGYLAGNFYGTLMDCSYFSLTTYTSLGFGDVEPFGNMRFLAGMESLTGLVLISWTASFMFIEMKKFWHAD